MPRFQSLNDLGGSQGTVPLVDATHRYKDKANTDIILIPQPSDDLNDPLNWPVWQKNAAFYSVIFFSALANWVIAGLGVGVVQVSIEFNRDIGSVVQDTISWCILTFGIGNFFWVPMAQYFGKRPIFVTAICGFFACTIWSAKTEGYRALVASRVLCAFFGACTEALPAAVVQDLFFLHERGKQMGIYEAMLQAGGIFGLVLAGFITDRGWRWNLWVCSIVAGLNLLWIFFFFPETLYVRNYDTGLDSTNVSVRNDEEKGSATETQEESEPVPTDRAAGQVPTIPRKPFLQRLVPWSPVNPQGKSLFSVFFRPWPMIFYPGLLYSFITFAGVLGWPICVISTNASIYQSPPYNFSPGINNLINLPAVIGCAIGAWSGGAFSDYLAERSARKNNGIFEPESRLVALIPSFFIVPIGLLMYSPPAPGDRFASSVDGRYGFAAERQLNWAVGYIGYGFIIFGIGAIPTITLTYLTDSYALISPDLMLLSIGLKNIFGFGFAYGVIPWISAQGYAAAFGTMVGVHCAILLFGIPLWYYGKRIRQATAGWKLIYG